MLCPSGAFPRLAAWPVPPGPSSGWKYTIVFLKHFQEERAYFPCHLKPKCCANMQTLVCSKGRAKSKVNGGRGGRLEAYSLGLYHENVTRLLTPLMEPTGRMIGAGRREDRKELAHAFISQSVPPSSNFVYRGGGTSCIWSITSVTSSGACEAASAGGRGGRSSCSRGGRVLGGKIKLLACCREFLGGLPRRKGDKEGGMIRQGSASTRQGKSPNKVAADDEAL